MTRTSAWRAAACVRVTGVASQPVVECCYAVTLQGSFNTVIVDSVVNDGDPVVWDRSRDLGMTNRIDRFTA